MNSYQILTDKAEQALNDAALLRQNNSPISYCPTGMHLSLFQ